MATACSSDVLQRPFSPTKTVHCRAVPSAWVKETTASRRSFKFRTRNSLMNMPPLLLREYMTHGVRPGSRAGAQSSSGFIRLAPSRNLVATSRLHAAIVTSDSATLLDSPKASSPGTSEGVDEPLHPAQHRHVPHSDGPCDAPTPAARTSTHPAAPPPPLTPPFSVLLTSCPPESRRARPAAFR